MGLKGLTPPTALVPFDGFRTRGDRKPSLYYTIHTHMSVESVLTDLEYCIDNLGCNDEQTAEVIAAAEDLGVSPQYFINEFIVTGDANVHQQDYLSVDTFNAVHGIYFEEE